MVYQKTFKLKKWRKKKKVGNIYRTKISLLAGGDYGYTFRIMPKHEMVLEAENLNLVKWMTEEMQKDEEKISEKKVVEEKNEMQEILETQEEKTENENEEIGEKMEDLTEI